MSAFKNTLNPQKFRATNAVWNELTLNSPWSIGYVSSLVESEFFTTKEEWEVFYYRSGGKRHELLSKETVRIRKFMNFHLLQKTKPDNIRKTPEAYRDLNFNYGRTREQLAEKGKILFENINLPALNITLKECIEAVRFRVICETWNGIVIRERNTVKNLQALFPKLTFKKTTGEFDHSYAVDYQIFKAQKLLSGIQIKPKSYAYQNTYLKKAKAANRRKNEHYFQKFKVPVLEILSDSEGRIFNRAVLNEIQKISKSLVI